MKKILNSIGIIFSLGAIVMILNGASCSTNIIKDQVLPTTSSTYGPAAYTKEDMAQMITNFANMMVVPASSVALIFAIYGGFIYLTSAGNQEKTDSGKKTLTWAVIGLILIIISYSVVNYFLTSLFKAS